MFRIILPAALVLVLVTAACGFSVDMPDLRVTPGPEVVDPIKIERPDTDRPVSLALTFGAGELNIAGGASGALVDGTATYNVASFKPEVSLEGTNASVKQGRSTLDGLASTEGVKNQWDLKLGSAPIDLTISAGAYKADYDFGGLALTSLTVNDGAAEVKGGFSTPNKANMDVLRYETGASNVTLTGLADANCNTLIFKSGAGNYTLDFGGSLRRDATVTVDSGLSNITLIIPAGIPAKVSVEAGLTNVSLPEGWEKNGNTYTQSGSGPTLTFIVKMGAGNLTITR